MRLNIAYRRYRFDGIDPVLTW